ncbi:PFL-like glycyl radical enzyme [Xylariaceae sp. AK1471]|nr:PFL-like glycyl radical enzyme [Xylariaceae sp. AK1471]
MKGVLNSTLNAAQRGLPFRPIFGQILTISLKKQDIQTKEALVQIIQNLDEDIIKNHADDCAFVAAFAPALWGHWTERDIPISTKVLDNGFNNFTNTGGDVLLYIKSPDRETAAELVASIIPQLEPLIQDTQEGIQAVEVGKRPDGRVVGGRYVDHISNPNDPISLAEDILISDPSPYHGATFGFTQKFVYDWPDIASQSGNALDAVIGRRPDGEIISQHSDQGDNAHIRRAHTLDENLDQRKLLRQALPFGESKGHASREEGLMFVAFCNDQQRFENILQNMLGDRPERPADRLMDFVQGVGGSYWYVPSAIELNVAGVRNGDDTYEDPHWDFRSPNGYLFYNSQDYMHQMAEGRYIEGDNPSVRILSLLSRTFNHWRDGWMTGEHFPRLPHLKELLPAAQRETVPKSILERKGLANFLTLSDLLSSPRSKIAQETGLVRIAVKELIVGAIPDFTLGRGKEVVPYLDEDETMAAWLKGELNEWSAMGHIVPNYQTLVDNGLAAMIADLDRRGEEAKNQGEDTKASFYISAAESLKGVQVYLENWAEIARQARDRATEAEDKENMQDVMDRLDRLVNDPPNSFQDAVQLIYTFHCCLHLVGELTAFGRLDQILWPFLERDSISPERAQEIVDCLWIKTGENAFVNRAFIYDYRTYGTTSVNGLGGNFPQGGGINQWVQQITIGGYKATDAETPDGGANPVTLLCLKAARRIPVNAPSLSLRVYKDMPEEFLHEAAKSILAGGAHPVLYNDDRLCEGLFLSGETVTRAWSRDYAADGCYEPMMTGASEFTFGNVAPMLALEQTLNQGSTYGAAGSVHLRGLKQTFRSPPVSDITSFPQLQDIFLKQLSWLVIQSYNTILNSYGNLADICPSPLLSSILDGCVESGNDLTTGGAKFHIIAPLCLGVANTIDSLYAIKKLCFDPSSARVTLSELVRCLICDWGFSMIEPFQDSSLGPANAAEKAVRYQELREVALSLPKWASGDRDEEVRELGTWFIDNMVKMCVDAIRKPAPGLQGALDRIYKKYGPDFEFVVTPGVGTFEGFVGDGLECGASADGRRNGMPIASDMSPVPAAQDLPAAPAHRDIYEATKSYAIDAVEVGISNAAPIDMNIPENFPLDRLQQFIVDFAQGKVGGNLLTLTCSDLETYQKASEDPEKYNLLRVRMGGWTEFYATMFPGYQEQQQRRQYFEIQEA